MYVLMLTRGMSAELPAMPTPICGSHGPLAGTIVVDGIVASTYIDATIFDPAATEAAMHRSVASFRLLARLAPWLVRLLHVRGLNQPAVLFMGREVPKVSAPPLDVKSCLVVMPPCNDVLQ